MDDLILLIATTSHEETLFIKALLHAERIKAVVQFNNTAALSNFTGTFGGSQFFVSQSQFKEAKAALECASAEE